MTRFFTVCGAALIVALTAGTASVRTQGAAGQQGPPQPPPTPRAAAPIDLTGYWVSIVNEDWRWRMVTPAKGDYASINLTPEGRKVADSWDPSTDGSCKAYGAAGLMRMPTRLHITWENDSTLRVDTDAGQQTRRLSFNARGRGVPSLQGHSVASWERTLTPASAFGFPGPPIPGPGGSLKVMTTNLTPGWLRRNGVPYSAQTRVTEYFDRFQVPEGGEWFVVTTIVEDPMYLQGPFTTSTHFRKEPDRAKWSPTPCKVG